MEEMGRRRQLGGSPYGVRPEDITTTHCTAHFGGDRVEPQEWDQVSAMAHAHNSESGGAGMYDRTRRVQEAAESIHRAMEEMPHLTWEQAQTINELTGWSLDSYEVPLPPNELAEAWAMAEDQAVSQ